MSRSDEASTTGRRELPSETERVVSAIVEFIRRTSKSSLAAGPAELFGHYLADCIEDGEWRQLSERDTDPEIEP